MIGARLIGLALGAALVGLALPAVAGPPQVTIYLGGYGQPQSGSSAPGTATSAAQPGANGYGSGTGAGGPGSGVLPGEVAWAQAAAYARYLQYLQLMNYQSARGVTPSDAAQYFTNGASVTTVPSSGQPGSAYFTNGSEVTVPPPAMAPPPLTPPPPAAPPQATKPSPWWWGDSTPAAQPLPPPPPSPPPAPPPAAAAPAPESATAVAAMSFDEWLQSMGAEPLDSSGEPETLAVIEPVAADDDDAPLSEPLAAAVEVQTRASYAPPEKRERTPLRAAASASSGNGAAIVWAFAAGLLLGALVMLRPRRRTSGGTLPL